MSLRALVQNLECHEPALVDIIRWYLPDCEWMMLQPQEFEYLREQVNIPSEALQWRPIAISTTMGGRVKLQLVCTLRHGGC